MSNLLMIEPMPLVSVVASRGTGAAFLGSRDPKEVWADAASGSPATLTIDLGAVRTFDTICLAYVTPPAAAAIWSISAGVDAADTVLLAATALRVPDAAGRFATTSHALWTGVATVARYVSITITQPVGAPLTIGAAVIGLALVTELGPEWGAGRQPIDTGVATALPSGGFAVVDGVRKRRYGWTFGDLSIEEADRIEQLALALGETKPGLVIENAARTPGLRARIWYCKFEKWKAYERRNRKQTRWELGIEEWV